MIRWNGSLVNEVIQAGLFGLRIKIAQVFILHSDQLITTIYSNSAFKGRFGGRGRGRGGGRDYWFLDNKKKHL